jgi:hypothetical protein
MDHEILFLNDFRFKRILFQFDMVGFEGGLVEHMNGSSKGGEISVKV